MSALGHKQTSRDVRVTSALPPIAEHSADELARPFFAISGLPAYLGGSRSHGLRSAGRQLCRAEGLRRFDLSTA
jgi:hypothetical protein